MSSRFFFRVLMFDSKVEYILRWDMLVNDLTFEKLKRNFLYYTFIRECFDFNLEFLNHIILFFFRKKLFS